MTDEMDHGRKEPESDAGPRLEMWQLRQRQSLPLEAKIRMSKERIRAYYEHFDGEVSVSFSGGKDSTVLLHLVRSMYPEVQAVFVDTGLEYPEVRRFVRRTQNVIVIRPEMPFVQVLKEYGFPVVSKEVSQKVYEIRNTKSAVLRKIRLEGKGEREDGKLADKWQSLVAAPFKISHKCCDVLKKRPARRVEKETAIITGEMASDSFLRQSDYLRRGCTYFGEHSFCKPLAFWTEQDILKYLVANGIEIAAIYGAIVPADLFSGALQTTGANRTGCMFCMFGVQHDPTPNRFQRMKRTHPKLWHYCIFSLGLKEPLDYMGVPYE